jgi:hypothetical protein
MDAFAGTAACLERSQDERGMAGEEAFECLSGERSVIARVLIEHLYDRARAVRWMSAHNRAFD